ncbi:MAG: energy-coupling factor transporter ATPase [Firmicutes bacterium]|nr:energy-coupling factor transporter ATPase [Bacillota bacterium]
MRVVGLHHRYNAGEALEVEALEGIDLTVRKGEFLVVIGPNGSGKSTLAKHMNALLLPTEGEVYVNGMDTRDPENLWQIRQTAGMVFQNPDNQIVATSVEEDVAFGPENLGLKPAEIRVRVAGALRSVDMIGYEKHAPHTLSGGQKQRVAIAGILAMLPDIIVLDEPTAMLDPQGRSEVLNTARRLNKEKGITVVFITHFMREAVEADRIVVMDSGRIVLDGTPREVFSEPERLREWGLDVPQIAELAAALREDGLEVPTDILTVDEMVDWICRSR